MLYNIFSNSLPPSIPSQEANAIKQWLVNYLSQNSKLKIEDHIVWLWVDEKGVVSWSNFNRLIDSLVYHMWRIERVFEVNNIIPSKKLNRIENIYNNNFNKNTFNRKSIDYEYIETDYSGDFIITNELQAKNMYLSYVANSFVLEKHSIIPWNLADYDEQNLKYLFGLAYFYRPRFDQKKRFKGFGLDNVTPSDPSEVIVWMFKKGWLKKRGLQTRFDQRASVRDYILNWWRDHTIHTSIWYLGGSSDVRTIPPSNYKEPEEYYLRAYWGSKYVPSLRILMTGYQVQWKKYQDRESQTSSYRFFLEPPSFMRYANPNIDKYIAHFVKGCEGNSKGLLYLLRSINIPSFSDATLCWIGETHVSLILPEEPSPSTKKPGGWILFHADDIWESVGGNPLDPLPTSSYFFTWKELIFELEKKKIPKEIWKTSPIEKSPSQLSDVAFLLRPEILISYIYSGLIQKDYGNIQRDHVIKNHLNFPTLYIIVYMLHIKGDLNFVKVNPAGVPPSGGPYYKGSVTGWIYHPTNLFKLARIYSPATISTSQVNRVLNNMYQKFRQKGFGLVKTYPDMVAMIWNTFDLSMRDRYSYD